MKIKVGKIYRTRSGDKVRILATDINNSHYPVCAVVTDAFGKESVQIYSVGGRFSWLNTVEHELDLISEWREPVKISGWVNVYAPGTRSGIYSSHTEADTRALEGRIACVYVKGTEELP